MALLLTCCLNQALIEPLFKEIIAVLSTVELMFEGP